MEFLSVKKLAKFKAIFAYLSYLLEYTVCLAYTKLILETLLLRKSLVTETLLK